MATDELPSAAAAAAAAAAAPASAAAMAAAAAAEEAAQGFSFSIWPPTQRTRDAVVRRLVDTLGGDTILCKRYGAVPAADAEPAARDIEAEAFDAAAASGAAAASVEEGIEALQLYSKEVSRRLLDFVKSRSAAAKADAATPSEGKAPAASSESEVVDPQPAE